MKSSEFESKENHNPMFQKGKKDSIFRDDASIDIEIKQIEMEMSRLFTKLEFLKLEKLRIKEIQRSVAASKQSTNQKVQESKTLRRGVSLCPSEIYSATKSRQAINKADVSSNSDVKQSSRRQSCFWKMGEIDELKVTKERGSSVGLIASISPKRVRKPLPKLDENTTMKKVVKKNDAVLSSVQHPKNNLFRDVASRYSKQNVHSSVVALSTGRVKKRWEIPAKGEIVVYKSERESTPVIDEIADDVLKKIKTVRCVAENRRVTRLADSIGKKS